MLGIGAFLATRYMEAGIAKEAAGYYRETSLKDFELISSLGVSEDNIKTIKDVPGVTDAEGVMQFDGSLSKGEMKSGVTVISRTQRISVPLLVDGKMPSLRTECAIGEDFAEASGIGIGDSVTIYVNGASDGEPLKGHEFKVSGLVKHPDYVHRKLTNTVVLPLRAFDMSATGDAYTRVFVKAKDVAVKDAFTEAYFEQTAGVKKALVDMKDSLADDRAGEVKAEANAEIDKEWDAALAELENAEDEIAANEIKLDSELAKGRQKLKNAESELSEKVKEFNKKIKSGETSIAEGEKQLKDAKEELKTSKEAYEAGKALFEENTGWMDDALVKTDYLLGHVDDADEDKPDDYDEQEQALASTLIEHQEQFKAIIEAANSKDISDAAKEIKKETGDDIMPLVEKVGKASADALLARANSVKAGEAHFTKEELLSLKDVFEVIRGGEAKETLEDAEKEIKDAEKEIAAKEKLLNSKKAELKKGKKQLKDEKASAENKIRAGWEKYYSDKSKYESRLAEAKALLEENREEAEAKLEEARAEVEKISCDFIVLDRNANAGYVEVKVQLDSLKSAGLVFGVLFVLITAIVCLSTLTIIIDEQRKLIGTVKAFGFHKLEVLSKYLIFAVSAGILGDILAVLTGLGLSEIVQAVYSATNMYQYGKAPTVMRPGITLIISAAMILVCAIASIIACSDILRSPASILMKGGKTQKKSKRKETSSSRGSLYSRLIIRNISDDKARVIVSTAIVAFCCMLIGIGISFKIATTGMLSKQESDVNHFDLRVDAGDSVTAKQLSKIENVISEKADDHIAVVYEPHLFSAGDTITGMTVLAGEPSELREYYGMEDEGAPAEISSDGVIIPVRMSEVYGYEKGSSVPVFDSSLELHDAHVTGTYTSYFERIAVTTPEGYSSIFGKDYEPRSFYLHLDGDTSELRKALLDISEDISFEEASDFREAFDSVSMLYNIIVYVTTGVAIFMSFMILTNLASIFVNRKKNELIVMRINGFSVKQTKGYLAREAVLTTVIGLAAGVIVGSLLTSFAIGLIEPADIQFDRSYHVTAWIFAAGLEGLFALIIYSSIFSRVKRLNLKDIA